MPEIGERMTMGALRSRGITVPRRRVRQMLHKVEPISAALRWYSKIKRKPYSVPGPNSLWHIGENDDVIYHNFIDEILYPLRWQP